MGIPDYGIRVGELRRSFLRYLSIYVSDLYFSTLNIIMKCAFTNDLDRSGPKPIGLYLFFFTATCVSRFLPYFSTNLNEIWHGRSP